MQSEEAYNLSERHSSSDSNKASSGEVSPYDNNSPVLSDRRVEPGSLASNPQQYSVAGQVAGLDSWGSKGQYGNDLGLQIEFHYAVAQLNNDENVVFSEEPVNIWGTWHSTLKPALTNHSYTGNQF